MNLPFAPYIQILGKGSRGDQDMSQQEADQSNSIILNGQFEQTQFGAFLMLFRIKDENHSEMSGFSQACREPLKVPQDFPEVVLDWATYAGKRRQLSRFTLSALMHAMQVKLRDQIYDLNVQASKNIVSCALHGCGHGRDRSSGYLRS